MWQWLKHRVTPANAACIAVLLAAIGVEVSDEIMRHVLEIIAAIIAIGGFVYEPKPPEEPKLYEPPNRQRT